MADNVPITGGCLCGAVRYAFIAPPIGVRYCWCRVCQHIAAGNATVNAVFRTEGMIVAGELRDMPLTADSGNAMHRRFCPRCGVHVFSEAEARPHVVIVRVGTLDDPEAARPQGVIWAASAPGWACMDPDLPRIDGQPPPA